MSDSIRDKIRSAVFSTKPESKVVEAFGVQIEVRQMPTGALMDLQSDGDRKGAMVKSIVAHCFVPKTNEKVFDETDLETLLTVPFGRDMVALSQAIGDVSGVDLEVADAVKNSEATQA